MKTLLSLTLLVSLGLFSTATLADHRSNRDHDSEGERRFSNRGNPTQHWDNSDRRTTYRRDRDNDVSVNLIIGTGSRPFQGHAYSPWSYRNNRPVVIEHNTYIERPAERGGVTTWRNRPIGTSLLRDLQGRCFERVTDRNGNEIRTGLDPSECDF